MKLFKKNEKKEYKRNSGSTRSSERHTEVLNRRRVMRGVRDEEKKTSYDYDDYNYVPSTVEDDTYLHLGNYPDAYEKEERRPDKGGQYMADDELKGYIDRWTIHGGVDRKYDDIYQTVAGMRINFKVNSPLEEAEESHEDAADDDYSAGFEERIKHDSDVQYSDEETYEEIPEYESDEWRAQYSSSRTRKTLAGIPGIDKAIKFTQRISHSRGISKAQERRKKRRARRKKIKKSVLVAVIIVVLLFVGFVVLIQADKKGCFDVDTVRIEGLSHYTEYDIIKTSGAETGVSLLSLNTTPMKQKIEKLPYVESATISKELPDTLVLTVNERIPSYAIYYGGAFTLVDKDFITLERTNDSGNCPIIEGFVPVSTPEPGKLFECKDENSFNSIMQMVECLEAGDLTFYKISSKDGVMYIYITKSIVIEGTYNNISNYIKEINEILYSQSVQGIERGTVHVGEDGYISFSPMI